MPELTHTTIEVEEDEVLVENKAVAIGARQRRRGMKKDPEEKVK
jgi:hypothetical protein